MRVICAAQPARSPQAAACANRSTATLSQNTLRKHAAVTAMASDQLRRALNTPHWRIMGPSCVERRGGRRPTLRDEEVALMMGLGRGGRRRTKIDPVTPDRWVHVGMVAGPGKALHHARIH